MTCREVNEYLDQTSLREWGSLPELLRKHLDGCKCCRGLWELLSRRSCPKQVPPEIRTQIEQQVLGALEPVTPLPGPGKLALAFFVIFGSLSTVIAVALAAPGAPGFKSFSFSSVVIVSVVSALLLSLTLAREMIPGQKRALPLGVTLSSGVIGLFATVAVVFPWKVSEPLLSGSWHCFKAGCVLALPAAGLAVLVLRRGAVLSPGAVGASAGLLAALVGVIGLHFSCTTQEAPHLALSHVGVPVVGSLVGYLAGRLMPRQMT